VKHLPNPPELVLLKALWAGGALPVRALHDKCAADLKWSFSSTRKTVERMVDKGMISITAGKGAALYHVRISKPATLARMTRDHMRRVLEIDGPVPATLFAGSQILSDDDLDEIDGLL